ncbi:MAG: D-sedoheptulose 7-phosphate isomerase [Alphaproteobacteria bacterium]|nr:MAG: D-sedoheptulose 7-phosphate isomerase [Alphaproteobacteria bacterium]
MRSSHRDDIVAHLEASRDLLARSLADDALVEAVAQTAEVIAQALRAGGKLLLAGNGGSAADAQHLACELVVRMYLDRAALPAIALTTDSSIVTAAGNDLGFDQIFSRQVLALGRREDVFLGLSTSGRSPNILAACKAARSLGMRVIGFTGGSGGSMAECCDVLVRVPSDRTPLIQQVHIAAGHIVCGIVEQAVMEPARD